MVVGREGGAASVGEARRSPPPRTTHTPAHAHTPRPVQHATTPPPPHPASAHTHRAEGEGGGQGEDCLVQTDVGKGAAVKVPAQRKGGKGGVVVVCGGGGGGGQRGHGRGCGACFRGWAGGRPCRPPPPLPPPAPPPPMRSLELWCVLGKGHPRRDGGVGLPSEAPGRGARAQRHGLVVVEQAGQVLALLGSHLWWVGGGRGVWGVQQCRRGGGGPGLNQHSTSARAPGRWGAARAAVYPCQQATL